MEPQSASCCGQLSQSPEVTESLLSSANQRVPQGSLSVLLLEPCRADAESILEELRNAGMPVAPTLVTSRDEFELAIQGAEFTAILSAYRLPGGNGLDALRLLRKNGNTTPFLLVTGSLGEDAAVECMKQGVSDYVLKDHLTRLPVALKRALEEGDLRHANAQVRMALTESEARNRELVENSVYGIFQISLEGTFHRANPSLLQMLTCNALEELRSLNLARDVFRYPEHYVKLVAACREHGLVHSEESEWRRKDGGLLSVRIHLRRLSVPGTGEILEGIVEDVTEVRALEHQLQQAQKFEAIGQLAGGIAHDFNNVVGAILGWAELGYEQSRDYPMIAERFARIREQADRAAGLTRELLAFARRQPLQVRPVDLNAIVSNFTGFLDKVIGKDIEIKGIPGPLPRIKTDSTQLEQVLMNLCLNARDAMPDGGRLTVKTEVVHVDDSFLPVASRRPARTLRGALCGRYRHGDEPGCSRSRLRAVLYDQRAWQGKWHGTRHSVWNRKAARGIHSRV